MQFLSNLLSATDKPGNLLNIFNEVCILGEKGYASISDIS
jgi:hypothetical protein